MFVSLLGKALSYETEVIAVTSLTKTFNIMADEQPKIDPAVLKQAQEAAAPARQVAGNEKMQEATEIKQHSQSYESHATQAGQDAISGKNAEFAKNQPSYDQGKVRRQDTPANLRSEPAKTQDGASRYGGAAPPSVNEQSQAQPVQSQESQAQTQDSQAQDGASRYGASQSSQPQGPTQDNNRGR